MWFFCVFFLCASLFYILSGLESINLENPVIRLLLYMIPLAVVIHAVWVLTVRRAVMFLLFASIVGFVAEVIGANYGFLFGGYYVYSIGSWDLAIFGIPLLIPLMWMSFTYLGYNVVSSFLFWINKNKPNKFEGGAKLLPLLILLDGFVVVALDMFFDPLFVHAGNWYWLEQGPYFGVPIGNFVGWFFIIMLITGTFRIFEYLAAPQHSKLKKSVFITPVISYGTLSVVFASISLRANLPELTIIGLAVTLPVAIINILLFLKWKLRQHFINRRNNVNFLNNKIN